MRLILTLALLLAGCSAADLKTTGEVLDILVPPPTPQESCERAGGQWVTMYHPRDLTPTGAGCLR